MANYPRLNGDISLLLLYGAIARAVYGIQNDSPSANHDDAAGDSADQRPCDPYSLNIVNYNWTLKQPMNALVRNGCDIGFGDLAAQGTAALAVRKEEKRRN